MARQICALFFVFNENRAENDHACTTLQVERFVYGDHGRYPNRAAVVFELATLFLNSLS